MAQTFGASGELAEPELMMTRRRGPFENETIAAATATDKQVKLGSGVGCPKVALVGAGTNLMDDDFEQESLP